MHLPPTLLLLLTTLSTLSTATLSPRQAVGAAAGAVPAPSPTQMSPITTYEVYGPGGALIPIPYTQTFAPTPDPWPAPTAGTIGLGTIQGVIGVVKPGRKREVAEPTGAVAGAVRFAREIVRRGEKVGKRVPGDGDGGDDGEAGEAGEELGLRRSSSAKGLDENGSGRVMPEAWSVGVVAVSVVLGALVAV